MYRVTVTWLDGSQEVLEAHDWLFAMKLMCNIASGRFYEGYLQGQPTHYQLWQEG